MSYGPWSPGSINSVQPSLMRSISTTDLFARVKTVYESAAYGLALDRQGERLVELTYRDFRRRGAELTPMIRKRGCAKSTGVCQNSGPNSVRTWSAETNGFELLVTDEADLAGLSETLNNSGTGSQQTAKGKEGWLFNLNRSTYEAFMTQSENRDLRKQAVRWLPRRGLQMAEHHDSGDI